MAGKSDSFETHRLSVLGFWGMGHVTVHVASNIFNKHI